MVAPPPHIWTFNTCHLYTAANDLLAISQRRKTRVSCFIFIRFILYFMYYIVIARREPLLQNKTCFKYGKCRNVEKIITPISLRLLPRTDVYICTLVGLEKLNAHLRKNRPVVEEHVCFYRGGN